jgi:hypothetical protein
VCSSDLSSEQLGVRIVCDAGNALPMAALLTDAVLIRSRAGINSLSTAYAGLRLDLIRSDAGCPQIRLSYASFSNRSVLKSAAQKKDIVHFVRLLTGSFAFKIRFTGSGYIVKAERALGFDRFRSGLIGAKVSSLLPQHKEDPPAGLSRGCGCRLAAAARRRRTTEQQEEESDKCPEWQARCRPSVKVPLWTNDFDVDVAKLNW